MRERYLCLLTELLHSECLVVDLFETENLNCPVTKRRDVITELVAEADHASGVRVLRVVLPQHKSLRVLNAAIDDIRAMCT